MLIVTSKAPGAGKQKPAQWGPLSSVQSAVLHNAKQLGIDPSTLFVVIPHWAGGGVPYNVLSGPATSFNGNWDNQGVSFNGSTQYEHYDSVFPTLSELRALGGLSLFMQLQGPNIANDRFFTIGEPGGVGNYFNLYTSAGGSVAVRDFSGCISDSTQRNSTTIFDNQPHTFSFKGINGGVLQNAQDGIRDLDTVSVTAADTGSVTDRYTFGALGRSTFSNHWTGSIGVVVLVSGIMSEEVEFRLHEAPYALLEPVPQTMIFDVATGPVTPSEGTIVTGTATATAAGSKLAASATVTTGTATATTVGEKVGGIPSEGTVVTGSAVATALGVKVSVRGTSVAGTATATTVGQKIDTTPGSATQVVGNAVATTAGTKTVSISTDVAGAAVATVIGSKFVTGSTQVTGVATATTFGYNPSNAALAAFLGISATQPGLAMSVSTAEMEFSTLRPDISLSTLTGD